MFHFQKLAPHHTRYETWQTVVFELVLLVACQVPTRAAVTLTNGIFLCTSPGATAPLRTNTIQRDWELSSSLLSKCHLSNFKHRIDLEGNLS